LYVGEMVGHLSRLISTIAYFYILTDTRRMPFIMRPPDGDGNPAPDTLDFPLASVPTQAKYAAEDCFCAIHCGDFNFCNRFLTVPYPEENEINVAADSNSTLDDPPTQNTHNVTMPSHATSQSVPSPRTPPSETHATSPQTTHVPLGPALSPVAEDDEGNDTPSHPIALKRVYGKCHYIEIDDDDDDILDHNGNGGIGNSGTTSSSNIRTSSNSTNDSDNNMAGDCGNGHKHSSNDHNTSNRNTGDMPPPAMNDHGNDDSRSNSEDCSDNGKGGGGRNNVNIIGDNNGSVKDVGHNKNDSDANTQEGSPRASKRARHSPSPSNAIDDVAGHPTSIVASDVAMPIVVERPLVFPVSGTHTRTSPVTTNIIATVMPSVATGPTTNTASSKPTIPASFLRSGSMPPPASLPLKGTHPSAPRSVSNPTMHNADPPSNTATTRAQTKVWHNTAEMVAWASGWMLKYMAMVESCTDDSKPPVWIQNAVNKLVSVFEATESDAGIAPIWESFDDIVMCAKSLHTIQALKPSEVTADGVGLWMMGICEILRHNDELAPIIISDVDALLEAIAPLGLNQGALDDFHAALLTFVHVMQSPAIPTSDDALFT
jgi:hypothetical protein